MKVLHLLAMGAIASCLSQGAYSASGGPVTFEHSRTEIPTYGFSRSMNVPPLFNLEHSKGIYPYAALDRESLALSPSPVQYESLTLENQYLRVTLLPELGGRVWSVWDKTRGVELFYQSGVIKPSSYNHRGGWPVGNLELYGPFDAHMLTWPGEPWTWAVKKSLNEGSVTVVLSHIDHFFRNKVSLDVTLHPGCAYLELTIRLHNKNTLPNRYLLWTNAGITATNGTRFIYPMTKTIGHDTAEFGSWPVFQDIDLSWYRNNKAMLGVFGLDVYDNFIAAYDYDADRGTVCYANRQIARGVKTWTWGVGSAGERHLKSYTDSGIPYIEVQSGRFVWDGNYEFLNPGKTDGWTEYWYGVAGLGGLTTASKDLAAHISEKANSLFLKLAPTRDIEKARLSWRLGSEAEGEEPVSFRVGNVLKKPIAADGLVDPASQLSFRVEADGETILNYGPGSRTGDFASDSIPRDFGPRQSLTAEELFQEGLTHEKLGRIDEAINAYQAALERDPGYTRPHLQLGLLAMSRFSPQEAVRHFQQVLARDPANGDAHYYLGWIASEKGDFETAEKHFSRLLPASDKFEQRDYGLGLISLKRNRLSKAERLLASAANRCPGQASVLGAYAYTLRRLGKREAAREECRKILALDPTSAFARAELTFLNNWADQADVATLNRSAAGHEQGYLELACEYMQLSAWSEAGRILEQGLVATTREGNRAYPMLSYYLAYALDKQGKQGEADETLATQAKDSNPISFFPFRQESVAVLKYVISRSPEDADAASLLGDLFYAKGHEAEAADLWIQAQQRDPDHFVSLRNLGWFFLEKGELKKASAYLERAATVRPGELEIVEALAYLYIRTSKPQEARRIAYASLRSRPDNDQLVELKAIIDAVGGDYDEGVRVLSAHRFSPRHRSYALLNLYQNLQLLRAFELTDEGRFEAALHELEQGSQPPSNLGIDDFAALKSSRMLFFEALVHELQGHSEKALEAWRRASTTIDHDYNGEGLFRTIALSRLGKDSAAWFRGFERVNTIRKTDSSQRVKVQAYYLSGIYRIFQGDVEGGRRDLETAIETDQSELASRQALQWLDAGLFRTLTLAADSPLTQE